MERFADYNGLLDGSYCVESKRDCKPYMLLNRCLYFLNN